MAARSWVGVCALLTISFSFTLAFGCRKAPPSQAEVMLAVAASLRNVAPELTKAYAEKHPGVRVAATYGASGDLRKQVEGGAPIDAVIFASGKPVDDLIRAGRADAASRKVLATNQLVLIGPKGGRRLTFATLEALPDKEKIAIGDPGAVPAGQYAREYLQKIGKWSAVQGRTVLGGDVSAVLAYARRGEVAAAIVYRTEVRGIEDVVIFDEAGADAPRIEVVSAVVSGASAAKEASAFLDFVASPEGQKILAHQGFGPP
jgi:molybdate transport system substrate-binding protein